MFDIIKLMLGEKVTQPCHAIKSKKMSRSCPVALQRLIK